MGRIACPSRKHACDFAQPPLHIVVDRIDARDDEPGFGLGAERKSQHRVEGALKAPHPAPGCRAKSAVVGDTLRDEGVRELQQDGRRPGEKENDLTLKFPSDRADVTRRSRP